MTTNNTYLSDFQHFKTIIVANGAAPTHPIPRALLQNADFIICCDGAIAQLEALGGTPNLIIGDCDSIDNQHFTKYQSIILENRSEAICDLHKSILWCIEHQKKCVTILGATGLREDHALANISLLMTYAQQLDLQIVTDFGVFTPMCKTTTFSSFPGQQVSVFDFGSSALTSHGLRYPIEQRQFRHFWEGSLNEAEGEKFVIEVENGSVLVYQTHEKTEKTNCSSIHN